MANIVAALFDDFETAEAALHALQDAGFPSADTSTFFLNAEGQHARFPIGGDQFADPGAKGAGKGAIAGAAIGGAAGLALGKGETHPEPPRERPAGVVVAAHAPASSQRGRAVSIFRRHRAHAIEEAAGRWNDGAWVDFDPLSIPEWRKPPAN